MHLFDSVGYNFGDFVVDVNGNNFSMTLYIYGSVVLVVYLILVAILLMNLCE